MAIASSGDFVAVVRDEARFRDWYDATLPRIYRYLAARCGGDDALVEEMTQQTFVEAIRQRHRFDGRSDIVTWMCAIGRNKLVDHYRRHGRDVRRQERLISVHVSRLGRAMARRRGKGRRRGGDGPACHRSAPRASSSATWMA